MVLRHWIISRPSMNLADIGTDSSATTRRFSRLPFPQRKCTGSNGALATSPTNLPSQSTIKADECALDTRKLKDTRFRFVPAVVADWTRTARLFRMLDLCMHSLLSSVLWLSVHALRLRGAKAFLKKGKARQPKDLLAVLVFSAVLVTLAGLLLGPPPNDVACLFRRVAPWMKGT
ncbi:unnamed protein product [Ixodes pacificus]